MDVSNGPSGLGQRGVVNSDVRPCRRVSALGLADETDATTEIRRVKKLLEQRSTRTAEPLERPVDGQPR